MRSISRHVKETILSQTIEVSESLDVIEIDKMWHYVEKKQQKLWIWLTYSRVIAREVGSRHAKTLRCLWARIKFHNFLLYAQINGLCIARLFLITF